MPIINLVNQSKTAKDVDVQNMVAPLQTFVSAVEAAWGMDGYQVAFGLAPVTGEWNVCIVDQFPNPAMTATAYGYHEVATDGCPVGYIRANAYGSRSLFGTYIKPLVILGKQITKPLMSPGVFSVICHEVVEMMVDPHVTNFRTDASGRNWILEPADHTVGSWIINKNNINAVAPDFTLPAFYNGKQFKPYSYLAVPPAPFTLVKGAYAYWKDSAGVVHKV